MKKRFSGPQIVAKLRQADVLIGQGKAVTCRPSGLAVCLGDMAVLVVPVYP